MVSLGTPPAKVAVEPSASAAPAVRGIPPCPTPPRGGYFWKSTDVPKTHKEPAGVCWTYALSTVPPTTTIPKAPPPLVAPKR
jgi:hypothetical protein